jgi:hypothetical protein
MSFFGVIQKFVSEYSAVYTNGPSSKEICM